MSDVAVLFWREIARWPWCVERYLSSARLCPGGRDAVVLECATRTHREATERVAAAAHSAPPELRSALLRAIAGEIPPPQSDPLVDAAYAYTQFDRIAAQYASHDAAIMGYASLRTLFEP